MTDVDEIKKFLTSLHEEYVIACDLETDNLNVEKANIIGISIAYSQDSVYIPFVSPENSINKKSQKEILLILNKLCEDEAVIKVFHNAKYDCVILKRYGQQEIVFAGGGEETHWTMSILFDAMGALSSKYNDNPSIASRAYDSERDGFVIAGGAGVVVVESLESAQKRGATIYAEIKGFGMTSDGHDMVQPSGEGAVRCMQMATQGGDVDYINSHGTSTPVGDMIELQSIKEVYGDNIPPISSTKSLTGHSLGATGAQEAIYSLLMMENNFLVESANISELDANAKDMNIILESKNDIEINSILSNSFGFGGTNASIYLTKFNE
ncbi:hypothetical protein N9751_01365 [Alphaproteobacteria bacterium]|nr:hypothetical protein [Alphaproteobacteria bacterium]